MFSRRLQLASFIGALQHHYRARLADMVSPFATRQIIELLVCLKKERLISAFTVCKQTRRSAFWSVRVFFYYTNNNGLLFQHMRGILPKIYLSTTQLQKWIRQKTSLAFPILIIDTPTHGIVTDRQLVYLQINGNVQGYLGGRLLARIDNY
jgi:ribosomal protein S8